MKISLEKIAKLVKGEVIGNSSHIITNISSFKDAKKNHITFADKPIFLKQICKSKAGAIIVSKKYNNISNNLIKVANPRLAFAKLLEIFYVPSENIFNYNSKELINKNADISSSAKISPLVCICEQSKIGKNSKIYPGVFIGENVIIGNNTTIHPNVTIMNNCKIGNNVTIHPGTVIGSDGFGFIANKKCYHKMPHVGTVQIDNNVEIGACNTIDRATIGKTWIKNGVKTDNMVHIAHNVTIGNNTLIVSDVAIAGSTTIGNNVIIAGKAGIAGHLNIGNNVRIGPKAGVIKSLSDGDIVSGLPAISHRLWLRVQRVIPALPDMFRTIRKLKDKIARLENNQK